MPAATPLAWFVTKECRGRCFALVVLTSCYALMQAIGMVNDYSTDPFRYQELVSEQ